MAHVVQGAVYNRLVGSVQGYEPSGFYIVNRYGDVETVEMTQVVTDLYNALDEMREIIAGGSVEPCYGAGRWPWESYVNKLAVTSEDVSLIPGIGPTRRQVFVEANLPTVGSVASSDERSLSFIPRVGPTTAHKFVTSASAISLGQSVQCGKLTTISRAKTEVFFDLEGTDPRFGSEKLEVVNYLIGAVVRHGGEFAEFVHIFAPSSQMEEHILKEFFQWADSLGDAAFYHWHHYERTHLTKMASHYGLNEALVSSIMEKFIDLSPLTTKSFAFPTYGEGLKEVAKCLGFTWRQEGVDALTSVVLYLGFVESGGSDTEALQKILDYNEDGCREAMHVFDWLLSQVE